MEAKSHFALIIVKGAEEAWGIGLIGQWLLLQLLFSGLSLTVAIATSKYASRGAFLSVRRACQIPIVLHHYLQRYSLLCVLTSILSHLMTSSVRNLHNTKILNISGTR